MGIEQLTIVDKGSRDYLVNVPFSKHTDQPQGSDQQSRRKYSTLRLCYARYRASFEHVLPSLPRYESRLLVGPASLRKLLHLLQTGIDNSCRSCSWAENDFKSSTRWNDEG
jgi:hypothetical protein